MMLPNTADAITNINSS